LLTERVWLKEVSNIPLQQALNDLNIAYTNFFKSIKAERKGKFVRPPRFKKRRGKQSARFRKGGFKINASTVADGNPHLRNVLAVALKAES
jgi:putative transposase